MALESPLHIVQISDIHLWGDPDKSLLGVNTQESFETIVNLVKSQPIKPHLIILSGDMSQDGSVASYQRVSQCLEEFKIPIYCLPGNHDKTEAMNKVYPDKVISTEKHILFDQWQLILLDSHIAGHVEGFLEEKELNFLKDCITQYPAQKPIIVFHHHPIQVNSEWLDPLGLTNADEFWDVLQTLSVEPIILFGHIHQVQEGEKNGVKYFSPPSTCIQFKPNCEKFTLDNVPPGFRWIELGSDGTFKTHVIRAPDYVGTFAADAEGY